MEEFKDWRSDLRPLWEGRARRQARRRSEAVTAREVMTSPVITVSPYERISEAARIMALRKIKRLPVVDGVIDVREELDFDQDDTIEHTRSHLWRRAPFLPSVLGGGDGAFELGDLQAGAGGEVAGAVFGGSGLVRLGPAVVA